jgi:arylsulfatase A-like enzyme
MGRSGADRAWVVGACLLLIVGPYAYYAWFNWSQLVPFEVADAVTYLWRDALNSHYWTNRSLTQRVIFTLLGNHLGAIAVAQLGLFLLTALAVFALFAQRARPRLNLAIAGACCFVFSSYSFNVTAVAVGAEPIFLSLLVLFPCVLFLERGRYGAAAALMIGLAFVFSRNLAPFALMSLIAARLLTARQLPDRTRLGAYAVLVTCALASISLTARTDTSLEVNTVNNIYRRVLPVTELVDHFQAEHGMPGGAWLVACKGRYVLDPCTGERLLSLDPASRNYTLSDDRHGFVRWVREEGRRAYLTHFFWEDPGRTHKLFRMHYGTYASDAGIRYPIRLLEKQRPGNVPDNRARLEASGSGRDVGFLAFDSLELLRDALLPLGLARLHSMLFLIAAGFALCRWLPETHHLALGTGMLATGLVTFCLAYFGDAVEIPRHVFPSLVLIVLGGWVYWIALLATLVREVSRGRARRKLVGSATLLALLSLGCADPSNDAPAEPRHVLLVVLDAASAAYFGAYGDTQGATPRIDALAAESVVFENSYSQSASTPPSVASLLTGVRVRTHGINGTSALSPWLESLPALLKAHGFSTFAISANPLASFQLDNGFDTYLRAWQLPELQEARAREDTFEYVVTRPSDINQQLLPRLRSMNAARVFAYVHYLQPHVPYDPPAELTSEFSAAGGAATWRDLNAAMLAANRAGEVTPDTSEVLEARYRANLRWVDGAVGELIDWLRESKRYDDTLFVLTSDHGDAFFGHRHFGHNSTLYDDMTRVPLLVKPHRGAGIAPGRFSNPVEAVDLAPTILDALGIAAVSQFEGDSLLPLMRGEATELPGFEVITSTIRLRSDAVRVDDYKLIRHADGSEELYDLSRDPGERNDCLASEPGRAAALRALLAQQRRGDPSPAQPAPELDPATRRLLERLGYAEGRVEE